MLPVAGNAAAGYHHSGIAAHSINEDQVDALVANGIYGAFLNSSQSQDVAAAHNKRCCAGKYKTTLHCAGAYSCQ